MPRDSQSRRTGEGGGKGAEEGETRIILQMASMRMEKVPLQAIFTVLRKYQSLKKTKNKKTTYSSYKEML